MHPGQKHIVDTLTKAVGEHGRRNSYDKRDIVKREAVLAAGGLKLAAYRVRHPETGEWSDLQYHMTYGDTIMALMGEESAKLFARFVTDHGTRES
jgi:hypothetical protein